MLGVNQWNAVSRFARMEEQWISAIRDCSRLEAQHKLDLERAIRTDSVLGGAHEPVSRVKLVAAARTRLLDIRKKRKPHEHHVPIAETGCDHGHGPRNWILRSARRKIHQKHTGGIHVHHFHSGHRMLVRRTAVPAILRGGTMDWEASQHE
jgi:hypothetical protein